MKINKIVEVWDDTLVLEKPKYLVNWYAFKYLPKKYKYYAELLCTKCVKEYNLFCSQQVFIVELGKVGDKCQRCFQTTNIPPNPFDHLPMSCGACDDIPSHNERDFDNAIELVTLDVNTYRCHSIYMADPKELLTLHQELIEYEQEYVRPDILVAAVNQLFTQEFEQMRMEFTNWALLGSDLAVAVRSLKS